VVDDSLSEVIDTIVKAEVHRLIVVDREQRVAGIISLSDILKHLVLDPPNLETGLSDSITNSAIGVIFKGGDSATDIDNKA
jgi:5'-AMP-activated protein kinase regulatory gamma subunit